MPLSDGQRFTGIFIAVDIGVQSHEENKTSLVDVFELSKRMRADRNGIISSAEHYNYIYEVSGTHAALQYNNACRTPVQHYIAAYMK